MSTAIITDNSINDLLLEFSKTIYKAQDHTVNGTFENNLIERCNALLKRDYNVIEISNIHGELTQNYPSKILIPESDKLPPKSTSSQTIYENNIEPQYLRELFIKARLARCRARFVVPVILYRGKYICRSSTISGCPEMYSRQGFESIASAISYMCHATASYFSDTDNTLVEESEFNEQNLRAKYPETQSMEFLNTYNSHVDAVRADDINLIKYLNVSAIVDLMVENKKIKYGLNVSSSEKIDKMQRYSMFTIFSLPYPGCEFFKLYRDNSYDTKNLVYDWNQSHNNAKICVPSADSAVAIVPSSTTSSSSTTPPPSISSSASSSSVAISSMLTSTDDSTNIIKTPMIDSSNTPSSRITSSSSSSSSSTSTTTPLSSSVNDDVVDSNGIASAIKKIDLENNGIKSFSSSEHSLSSKLPENTSNNDATTDNTDNTDNTVTTATTTTNSAILTESTQSTITTSTTSTTTTSEPTTETIKNKPVVPIKATNQVISEINWDDYMSWDLLQITQNYLKLQLSLIQEQESGILVHCISGWDRTPLFISLLRISLWADEVIHKSLTPFQLLYFTIAYDWYLFGHNLPDRLSKGEDIFYFCFYILKHFFGREYSIHNTKPSRSKHNSTCMGNCDNNQSGDICHQNDMLFDTDQHCDRQNANGNNNRTHRDSSSSSGNLTDNGRGSINSLDSCGEFVNFENSIFDFEAGTKRTSPVLVPTTQRQRTESGPTSSISESWQFVTKTGSDMKNSILNQNPLDFVEDTSSDALRKRQKNLTALRNLFFESYWGTIGRSKTNGLGAFLNTFVGRVGLASKTL